MICYELSPGMELRQLRYFDAVATDQHVTNAAIRLGVAQPALSQQIKALERELGFPLLQRVGRRVQLTEAGRVFHQGIRPLLDRLRATVDQASEAARGLTGRVVVGFTESASFSPAMTSVIATSRRTWPQVQFELVQDRTTALVQGLRERRIDVALVRPALPDDGSLRFVTLAEERLLLAVPQDHRLARRRQVAWADLAEEGFISLDPRLSTSGLDQVIEEACRKAGFTRRVVQRSPLFSSSINLVAASLGVAVVPECMAALRHDAVRYVALSGPGRAVLGLAHRPDERAPAVLNLIALAEQGR